MNNHSTTRISDNRRSLSFSSIAIILIFFLVTSQVLILPLPNIVTQLFRPLLVAMIIINMQKNGFIRSTTQMLALLLAFHAGFSLLLHPELWNEDNIINGVAVFLYFLMVSFAIAANWSKRELKWILAASFFGCFVCAVALLASNNPVDFHAANAGHLSLAGFSVNRNKNAYQYAFGTVLGMIYLLKGRNNPKLIIFLMTAVQLYALLYSQCRGAFISAVAAVTVLFLGLLLEVRKKNGGRAMLWLIVMIVAYIAAYYLLKNSELSRLVDGENTSGRDEGIKDAWNIFLRSGAFEKVFGNGFGFEATQIEGIGAHMVHVSYLVSMGLIGAILTIGVFYSAFKMEFGAGAYALLAVSFMKTFFEGADYNVFIPLILSIVICNYTRLSGRKYYGLFGKT